ncbi:ACT domain-containing protein ACR3 [Cryptomeria japonica]|uniref:ACT domain-containing protein ACR3 n=1 Tax=Cryptomeria japonica TaxID=3369 RepID=UPI0025AD969F|nr:ACT domain-containing protein ACR3 [Cryptomeria japonica]XP_059066992.1 ACT domain-containing protein ACR3 [Cryptomeria japonica]XP_059066993.1 ACT domain-containing protein ACR3 [Cryptomeria japonica]XP_059066994.1 ACT domain-containing protein ACR3 [Cryptomeria japonica]
MESNVCWPYFDPEYESLSQRIHPPMVGIDNDTYGDCSLVMVDSANRHGILLEVVQVLTDLDLIISKAYISSDGGWFMDVFHVTDQLGNKLTDQRIIDYIKQALGAKRGPATMEVRTCLGRTVGVQSIGEHTAIEMTGTDRPGLLSEISAVLTNLNCNVVAAEVWTHNMRVACVVYITDELTSRPIEEPDRLATIKEQLSNVLKGNDDRRGVKTDFSMGLTHTERRLHQMMFADRDYEGPETSSLGEDGKPIITIDNCIEKGYSVVTVHSKDRPKLLFDTVCTLTDMQYVVFHASINSSGSCALQEYYIRHMDGCTLDTEGEKQRVIKCLEAAIERRVSEGLRLELCTSDRVGLLSDITRIFRENGLSVTRADVTTRGDKAVNVFYVTDASGNPVDMKIVEAMRKEIGDTILQVKNVPSSPRSCPIDTTEKPRFSFGSLLKSQLERISYNIGLIKS